jgi:F-type H+-transporting ATPase subunit epsilon
MAKLRLEIVTPSGTILDCDVKMVTLPGREGEFGILPKHASLITLLKEGIIEYELEDSSKGMVAINWGYIKIEEGSATILADGAVAVGGVGGDLEAKIREANELISTISDDATAIANVKSKFESVSKGML